MSDTFTLTPPRYVPRHQHVFTRCGTFLSRPNEYHMTSNPAPSDEFARFVDRVVEITTPITGVLVPRYRNDHFAFLVHPEDDGFTCAAVSLASLPDTERRRKATFNVFAGTLTNKRYAEGEARHHSKAHKNEDAAVASAKKYIRRPTRDQLIAYATDVGCNSLRHLVVGTREVADKEVYDALSAVPGLQQAVLRRNTISEFDKLVETSILGAALHHYASLPEAPATLRNALSYVAATKERLAEFYSTHSTSMAFVLLGGADMETAYVVEGHVLDIDAWSISFSRHNTYSCPSEELPELIRGRISVLNMCMPEVDIPYTTVSSKDIVEGVGMRISERVFFVVSA